MEVEIYSNDTLFDKLSLEKNNTVEMTIPLVYGYDLPLTISDGEEFIPNSETVVKIYGENVTNSDRQLYHMDGPLTIEAGVYSNNTVEGWETYTLDTEIDGATVYAELSFDPTVADSYIETLKELEATGNPELAEELAASIITDEMAHVDAFSVGLTLPRELLSGEKITVGVGEE